MGSAGNSCTPPHRGMGSLLCGCSSCKPADVFCFTCFASSWNCTFQLFLSMDKWTEVFLSGSVCLSDEVSMATHTQSILMWCCAAVCPLKVMQAAQEVCILTTKEATAGEAESFTVTCTGHPAHAPLLMLVTWVWIAAAEREGPHL